MLVAAEMSSAAVKVLPKGPKTGARAKIGMRVGPVAVDFGQAQDVDGAQLSKGFKVIIVDGREATTVLENETESVGCLGEKRIAPAAGFERWRADRRGGCRARCRSWEPLPT
jgi:hypothetical protein